MSLNRDVGICMYGPSTRIQCVYSVDKCVYVCVQIKICVLLKNSTIYLKKPNNL